MNGSMNSESHGTRGAARAPANSGLLVSLLLGAALGFLAAKRSLGRNHQPTHVSEAHGPNPDSEGRQGGALTEAAPGIKLLPISPAADRPSPTPYGPAGGRQPRMVGGNVWVMAFVAILGGLGMWLLWPGTPDAAIPISEKDIILIWSDAYSNEQESGGTWNAEFSYASRELVFGEVPRANFGGYRSTKSDLRFAGGVALALRACRLADVDGEIAINRVTLEDGTPVADLSIEAGSFSCEFAEGAGFREEGPVTRYAFPTIESALRTYGLAPTDSTSSNCVSYVHPRFIDGLAEARTAEECGFEERPQGYELTHLVTRIFGESHRLANADRQSLSDVRFVLFGISASLASGALLALRLPHRRRDQWHRRWT